MCTVWNGFAFPQMSVGLRNAPLQQVLLPRPPGGGLANDAGTHSETTAVLANTPVNWAL